MCTDAGLTTALSTFGTLSLVSCRSCVKQLFLFFADAAAINISSCLAGDGALGEHVSSALARVAHTKLCCFEDGTALQACRKSRVFHN